MASALQYLHDMALELPFRTGAALRGLLRSGTAPSYDVACALLGCELQRAAPGFGDAEEQGEVVEVLLQLRQMVPHIFVYQGLATVISVTV